MLVFLAGSLVARWRYALSVLMARSRDMDVPAVISLGVSTLLALCMDVAMPCGVHAAVARCDELNHAWMRLHRGVMG
jgi:hypothetical protein